MTVAEMIEKLRKYPNNAHVYFRDGEYYGSMQRVNTIKAHSKGWGYPSDCVVIE